MQEDTVHHSLYKSLSCGKGTVENVENASCNSKRKGKEQWSQMQVERKQLCSMVFTNFSLNHNNWKKLGNEGFSFH